MAAPAPSASRVATRLLIACAPLAALAAAPLAAGDGTYPDGRMTGGGSVFTDEGTRVTHGFTLHCSVEEGPNNLQVNWDGNRFHLETMTFARCRDSPSWEPDPPEAPLDVHQGRGTGRLNGVGGYCIEWVFADKGEPGVPDTAGIRITDCLGAPVFGVGGPLERGNHQAHFETPA